MNTKENKGLGILAVVVLAAVYSIIVFLLDKHLNIAFWLTYAFTMLAFLLQIIVPVLTVDKRDKVKDIFIGLPILLHTVVYLIIQVIVSIIFYVFYMLSVKAVVIIQIIFLAVYLLILLSALFQKNTVNNIEKNIQNKKLYIQTLLRKIEKIEDITSDYDIKAYIYKLKETIEYSDPMSSDALYDIESRIVINLDTIYTLICNQQKEAALSNIRLTINMCNERNKKCEMLKGVR